MIPVTIWGDVVVKSLQFSQKDPKGLNYGENETEPSAKIQEAFHPPGEFGRVQCLVEACTKG
jgi:hypothetical protein